jgi:hypothetical protein
MNDQAWPFLIGRTRTQDHRIIVIPEFMTGGPLASALRSRTDGEPGPPGIASLREIQTSTKEPVTVIYRVFFAHAENYGLPGDGLLTDEHGRPILLTEGLALRRPASAVQQAGITQADLDHAHALVMPAYQTFWNEGAQFARHSSEYFALARNEPRGTPLTLVHDSPEVHAEPSAADASATVVPSNHARARSRTRATTELVVTAVVAALVIASAGAAIWLLLLHHASP